MPTRRPRKAVRPDDKRLKANRPDADVVRVKTKMQQLIDGDITVSDLDDEEIRRGRCKGTDGKFHGNPPRMLPRVVLDALRQEYIRRNEEEWQAAAHIARRTLIEVATNPLAQAQARVSAALAIAERAEGKVPDKVQQTIELKPFEQDLEGLLIDVVDQEGQHVLPTTRKRSA